MTMLLQEKSTIVVGRASQEADQTNQISIITSIVSTMKQLIYPISWVQTCIPILPFELIDVLDAPMPYMVGILDEEWQYYTDGSMQDLSDKCIIQINDDNTIDVKYIPEGDVNYESNDTSS